MIEAGALPIEVEKVKEKAKRDENTAFLSRSASLGLIIFALIILTVMTSYGSLGVLPELNFFYFGSLAVGMSLSCLSIILMILTSSNKALRIIGLLAVLAALIKVALSGSEGLFGIAVLGSWICGIPALFFYFIPKIVFPLLLVFTIVFLTVKRQSLWTIPPQKLQLNAILLLFLVSLIMWGHAFTFEGDRYDENLVIEGKTYHSIVYYGWLGDPGTVTLYECQIGYFFCSIIYQSPRDSYDTYSTSLLYDESIKTLRLEYLIAGQDSRLLFEYNIPD